MLVRASGSYYELLNIYATQYDGLLIAQKKLINVLNRPENLTLDFYLDEHEDEYDLSPMPPQDGKK